MFKDWAKKFLSSLDLLGSVISTACAIHCLLLPILILILPLLGLAFILEESFEFMLLVSALAIAFSSFLWGHRSHGEIYVFYFLSAALGFFGLGRLESLELYERYFVAIGGILLVAGHIINRKLCNTCPTCHDCHCSETSGSSVPEQER